MMRLFLTVCVFFAAIVSFLLCRLCGALRAPLGAINDDVHRDTARQHLLQILRVPFGQTPRVPKRQLQDGRELMNPLIRASLAPIEQKREDFLQGINFEIEEDKQQFVFNREQPGFASTPKASLPHVLWALERRAMGMPRLGKGHEQLIEFVFVESRERAQCPGTILGASIGEHEAPL